LKHFALLVMKTVMMKTVVMSMALGQILEATNQ
jgi:hypothetical protein